MYSTIQRVHLEVTSKCNARCPQCMRNVKGSPFIATGLEEVDLSVDTIRSIFSDPLLSNVTNILINGNYGDFVMHESPLEIVEEIKKILPNVRLKIHTNGGALKDDIWRQLAKYNPTVEFGIDGLEDTHHLYRRNTSYKTVIKNAKAFIDAGGNAEWMMTVFKHNQHQIEECRKLAEDLGFSKFTKRVGTRGFAPVLDSNLELEYVIEPSDLLKTVQEKPLSFFKNKASMYALQYKKGNALLVDPTYIEESKSRWYDNNSHRIELPINCKASNAKEIYISAQGLAYPCCWIGAQKTYGKVFHFYEFEELLKSNNISFSDIDLKINSLSDVFKTGYFDVLSNSFTTNKLKRCIETCTSASNFDLMQSSKQKN